MQDAPALTDSNMWRRIHRQHIRTSLMNGYHTTWMFICTVWATHNILYILCLLNRTNGWTVMMMMIIIIYTLWENGSLGPPAPCLGPPDWFPLCLLFDSLPSVLVFCVCLFLFLAVWCVSVVFLFLFFASLVPFLFFVSSLLVWCLSLVILFAVVFFVLLHLYWVVLFVSWLFCNIFRIAYLSAELYSFETGNMNSHFVQGLWPRGPLTSQGLVDLFINPSMIFMWAQIHIYQNYV